MGRAIACHTPSDSKRLVIEPVEMGRGLARLAVTGRVEADVDAGKAARDLRGEIARFAAIETQRAICPCQAERIAVFIRLDRKLKAPSYRLLLGDHGLERADATAYHQNGFSCSPRNGDLVVV